MVRLLLNNACMVTINISNDLSERIMTFQKTLWGWDHVAKGHGIPSISTEVGPTHTPVLDPLICSVYWFLVCCLTLPSRTWVSWGQGRGSKLPPPPLEECALLSKAYEIFCEWRSPASQPSQAFIFYAIKMAGHLESPRATGTGLNSFLLDRWFSSLLYERRKVWSYFKA